MRETGVLKPMNSPLDRAWFRIRQLTGKFRRFYYASVATSGTAERLAKRDGDCNRCGACCKILYRCPFLAEPEPGVYACRIYGHHFAQCKLYPLTPADLTEIDGECTYTFRD